ncbi:MAG TPA: protein kinase [Gemmatimonadaceae bacterium]|nr:protein kinase [Gemmatimonadaceae bacterium]
MHTTEQLNSALAGRYEVERQVGQGGMATVYLARDLRHNRRVAVKVLSSELAAIVGRERFLSEIEVTANLQHPHLLPLFDSGDAGGLLFYVMPFIEGETLRKRLERERQLSVEDAVHIASAIGSALDYAHRHGVIHRDLKPENILMHERDPLVMDFGIALAVSNAGGARVTQAGISLGTPQYMSPEQATGDRQIDARSDIYSLGAVTYEMLAGEPPHSGTSIQAIMAKVIADRPRSVRELRDSVPEYVDDAVMRALAKLPADRWPKASEFVSAITGARVVALTNPGVANALSGTVRQLPYTPPTQPLVSRRALSFGAAGIALAALGGAIGARSMRTPIDEPQARYVLDLPDSVGFSNTQFRQVALARDGSRAVFHFSNSFPGPLYTRRTGELHFDIIPGSDSARSMVISPDAKHVLYWYNAAGPGGIALMKIAIDGGPPVRIADSATAITQASWGDGDQVLFRRGARLILVSSDGGPERVIARPDTANNQFALGWPEFLPGGKAALITIHHGRGNEVDSMYLGVVSVADGKVVDLGVRGLTPHYASGHVLYVDSDGQLFARPFDVKKRAFTAEARVIAKDLSVRRGGASYTIGVTDLAVSDAGTLLMTDGGSNVGGGGGSTHRSIVMRHGRETEWLRVPQRAYEEVRASPNGLQLALTVRDSSNSSREDIWLLTLATGQLSPFTRDGKSSQPRWSADSKTITFRVTEPDAKPPIRFFNAPADQSEPPKAVAFPAGIEDVELPGTGGKFLAYVRGDSGAVASVFTNSDILLAPVDSLGAARPFAALGIRERMPRFSPNGKWLAYNGHELPSTSGGTATALSALYVRPVPGPGAPVQVSIANGNTPLWSHDGRTLFYFSGTGGAGMQAARISEAHGFEVTSRENALGRPAPGTGFANPTARWSTDILPNDDIVYVTNTPPPALPAVAAVAAAPAPAVDTPSSHLVAIVNWLTAEHSASPKR